MYFLVLLSQVRFLHGCHEWASTLMLFVAVNNEERLLLVSRNVLSQFSVSVSGVLIHIYQTALIFLMLHETPEALLYVFFKKCSSQLVGD